MPDRATSHISYKSFESENGTNEYVLLIETGPIPSFDANLDSLQGEYKQLLDKLDLGEETQIFSRVFLSDIDNQRRAFDRSGLSRLLSKSALSLIQQRPLSTSRISLFSYHLKKSGPGAIRKKAHREKDGYGPNVLSVEGTHYDMLWASGFTGEDGSDSYSQSSSIMEKTGEALKAHGMDWLQNALRTWIYVRDIDNNYEGLVRRRKEIFDLKGLTEKTRYLASTGIEGKSPSPGNLISMDTMAISNLRPGQIVRMEAPEHMSPTIDYGVTFERGLRVRFGDRSHLHISGTASIDAAGEVLHLGDPKKQTERTIENITALLAEHGANISDMMYLFVYLRDGNSAHIVREALEDLVPAAIPRILLEAPVCRPAWLVEIEGVAVVKDDTEYPDFL